MNTTEQPNIQFREIEIFRLCRWESERGAARKAVRSQGAPYPHPKITPFGASIVFSEGRKYTYPLDPGVSVKRQTL